MIKEKGDCQMIKWFDKSIESHKCTSDADVVIRKHGKVDGKVKQRYSIRLSQKACQRVFRGNKPTYLRIGTNGTALFIAEGNKTNGYKMREPNKTDNASLCETTADISKFVGEHQIFWNDKEEAHQLKRMEAK